MRRNSNDRRKKVRTTALCFFSLFMILSAPFSARAAWMSDPPFLLGEGMYPDVAVGPGDHVHVAWMTTTTIYYRYFNGTTWQATETVPMGGAGIVQKSAPDIWADSNDVPHVVWGDNGGLLYYINRDGGSWGTPELIVDNPDPALWNNRDVRIAVASDGKRHVIWRRTDLSNGRGKIFHQLWSNGSWGPETQVSEGTMTSKRCHLTLGPDDALHVVWRQKTGPQTSYEVMYRKWVAGSFQPVISATYTVPRAGEDPHVAVDPSNYPHISFPEATDVGYLEWLGGEFSEVAIVGTGTDPVIAIDDAGAKYIFWDDNYSVDIGSGWDTPQTYVAGSYQADVIGGTDRANLVYRNGTMAYYVGITAGGGPPPPDTTITVSSPNGSELWQVGSTHNIVWNTTGLVDEVDVAYSIDGGNSWTDLALGIPNQGYYSWIIPNSPSDLCRVRVEDTSDGDPTDTSDANFTITDVPQGEESIQVSSPDGGEWWQVGTQKTITWESSMNFTYVRIEYSTDAGRTWIMVTSRTANDGARSWTVPNTPSDSCMVKIMDWADQDPEDVSNAVFTIGSGTPPPKTLTVLTPNGGEILEVGSSYAITWDHTGSVSDVAIHYSTDNGTSWISITNRTANDHERSWTIPDAQSDSCLIRVQEADTRDPLDISDSIFSIVSEAPSANLTLLGPNGGEVFLAGAEALITWQSTGAIDSVQLQYSLDDGGVWDVIEMSYPNTGSYTWTTPPTPSLLAKVKILDVIGGEVSDQSDSTFALSTDVTAPALDTLYLSTSIDLVISFTEPVEETSAELTSNYSIDNGISIISAQLDSSLTMVHLTTDSHSSGVTYTVTIDGVRDRATPPNVVAAGTTGEYEYNPSGIGGGNETTGPLPKAFSLSQNYPNPFNPQTTITIAIPEEEGMSGDDVVRTRLTIYNLKGQLIRMLFDGDLDTGYHSITWDGKNDGGSSVGSGVYLYRLEAGSFVTTKKMMLVK